MSYGTEAPDANAHLKGLFRIEIDGMQVGGFQKINISKGTWGSTEHRAGDDDLTKQEASAIKSRRTITLSKIVKTGGDDIIDLMEEWHNRGTADLRSGSIVLLDRDGNEVKRWDFRDAWCKEVPEVELDATSDDALDLSWTLSVREVNPR